MTRRVTEAIDGLYQTGPNDFTRERNALAKEAGGEEGKRIRALQKPSMSAWAVNQLYWKDRETYDALVAASERLRTAHRAVLGGRKADLVGADAGHRDAVKAALTATLGLVKEAGQRVSASTHSEIAQTLETLSPDDSGGHLSKPLRPEGFEALQGMPVRGRREEPAAKPARAPREPASVESGTRSASERGARATEIRARRDAQRAVQAARRRERQERATVARLEKRVAQAERATGAARTALERAQTAEAKVRSELQRARDSLDAATGAARELVDKTDPKSRRHG